MRFISRYNNAVLENTTHLVRTPSLTFCMPSMSHACRCDG